MSMRRYLTAALSLPLAVALAGTLGGCERKVEVRTGTRVMCTYGHEISDNVKMIEVPAKKSSSYKVRVVTRTCPRHASLERLYAEAQAALRKGDLAAARKKLEEIVLSDPSFRSASSQLAVVKSGKKPSADNSRPGNPTGGKTNPGQGDVSGPVGSLMNYTPDTLDGFVAQPVLNDPNQLTRIYRPTGTSDCIILTAVAEQERTAAVAGVMLTREVKDLYPVGATTVTAGSRKVYFGTDGSRYAAAGFCDGSIFVVYEMAVKRGVDPAKLKASLIAAVAQIR